MAFNPRCECPWEGEPTFDHADAVAQCRTHYQQEHSMFPELPLMIGGLF